MVISGRPHIMSLLFSLVFHVFHRPRQSSSEGKEHRAPRVADQECLVASSRIADQGVISHLGRFPLPKYNGNYHNNNSHLFWLQRETINTPYRAPLLESIGVRSTILEHESRRIQGYDVAGFITAGNQIEIFPITICAGEIVLFPL
jgi:hypothetical protein